MCFYFLQGSILPQYVLQQQTPEVLLTPQVLNLNPQLAGPFGPQGPQLLLPNQGNQLTPMLVPNGQQDQLGPAQDPNNPNGPQQAQNPVQVTDQQLKDHAIRLFHQCTWRKDLHTDKSLFFISMFLADVSTVSVSIFWIPTASQTAGFYLHNLTHL